MIAVVIYLAGYMAALFWFSRKFPHNTVSDYAATILAAALWPLVAAFRMARILRKASRP